MEDFNVERVKAVALRLGFELSEQSDSQELETKIHNLAKFFYMDGAKSVALQAIEYYQKYQDPFVRECRDIANSAYYTHSRILPSQVITRRHHER